MKHSLNSVIGINQPPDGFTIEEQHLANLIGEQSVSNLYARLPTSRMKAIVAMHFELGYKQELIAEIFGITQARIAQEILLIRRVLSGKPYSPYKIKAQVSIKDLLELCILLQKQ